MEFESIRYFKDRKVLDLRFTKNTEKLELGRIINFSKTGQNYYLKYEDQKQSKSKKRDQSNDKEPNQYQLDLDNNTEAYLDSLIDKELTYIARLKDESTVEVLTFNNTELKIDLPILLSEILVNGTNRKTKDFNGVQKELLAKYTLGSREMRYALLGMKKEEEKEEFILLGKDSGLSLERKKKEYFKTENNIEKKLLTEVFEASKEIVVKNYKGYSFYLVKGRIEFLNDTDNFREKIETTLKLEELKNDSSSYLNMWENYQNKERENSLKLVQEQGYFKIEGASYQKRGKREFFELTLNKPGKFDDGDTLRIIERNPEGLFNNYVKNEEEFFGKIEKFELDEELVVEKSKGRVLVVKGNKRVDEKTLNNSYLFYSMKGNDAVFKRRKKAKDLITNGKAAMPDLNLVIEGRRGRKSSREHLSALSPQTKYDLFPKYDPTATQQRAIEVALNTPDIALIQGPPGTGKTTVITAILQRLSEERKKIGGISGNNLITSFQHDAVSNATARIKILGLPAEKYGKKDSTDGHVLNKIFKSYINETLKNYYDAEPSLKRRKEEDELLELYSYYNNKVERTPEKEEVKRLLKKLRVFSINYGNQSVLEDIEDIEKELRSVNRNYSFIEKRFFKKLPISSKALEDCGMEFVEKSIGILEEAIQSKEINKDEFQGELKVLMDLRSGKTPNFKLIEMCKVSILSKLTSVEDPYIDKAANRKVDKVFEKLSAFVEELKTDSKDNKENLKVRYLRELEDNPLRVRDTLRSYMTTFGATCQQTQGKEIKLAKNGNEKLEYNRDKSLQEFEIYENVLVDEAARSNPPDLLIPMSMASEKIILVGDHKQLPHIVDENIVDHIKNEEKSVKDSVEDQIKLSMFEVLKNKCLDLERMDGIKRTIMLDQQYRMHPEMGDFVSEQFYEGKLGSGLSADKFNTRLKGFEGKAFAWLDLPYTKKYEEKKNKGGSTYRNIEAKEIAKFIYKHIDSEETRGQNFGVITFYAEQREEIFKELANEENLAYEGQELAVKNSQNGYEIAEKYAFSKESGIDEKLRVGSVDAFQGMEFNYVCLSMVRSNDFELINESDVRRKFGFLTNPNRLCVAMSRQKELIIMFGDSKMLENGEYKDIKPLKDYLRKCREEGEYGKFKSLL